MLCVPAFVPFFVCLWHEAQICISSHTNDTFTHNGNVKNQEQRTNGNCQSSLFCELNAWNFVVVSCSCVCLMWIMCAIHEWSHCTCTTNRKRFENSNMQDKYSLAFIALRFWNNIAELFYSTNLRNARCFSLHNYKFLVEFRAFSRNQAFLIRHYNQCERKLCHKVHRQRHPQAYKRKFLAIISRRHSFLNSYWVSWP